MKNLLTQWRENGEENWIKDQSMKKNLLTQMESWKRKSIIVEKEILKERLSMENLLTQREF